MCQSKRLKRKKGYGTGRASCVPQSSIDNVPTGRYTFVMAIVKTDISLERDLLQKTDELAASRNISRDRVFVRALQEYHQREENLALLEKINAAYDDTPDPENEKALKASQRAFTKVLDEYSTTCAY